MGDLHRLRGCGGSRGELQQRRPVLVDLHLRRFPARLADELPDREGPDAGAVEHLDELGERIAEHDRPGVDQGQHRGRLRAVGGQIGPGGRLMQHGDRRPGEPGRLRRRRDLEGLGGQHGHRVARPHPVRGQHPRTRARRGVHLRPTRAHRFVRLAGRHPGAALRCAAQGLGEGTHWSTPGSMLITDTVLHSYGRPVQPRPRLTVLGSINMDLAVRTARLPGPGETVLGTTFATAQGGKGANQAIAAARAGADVTMIGAVGTDAFGTELTAALRDQDITIDLLRTVDGPSGIAVITVDDGRREHHRRGSGRGRSAHRVDRRRGQGHPGVGDAAFCNWRSPSRPSSPARRRPQLPAYRCC